MPEKARHGKPHSKKGKARQRVGPIPVQGEEVHVSEPARAVTVTVEKPHATTPSQKVRYPYITAELKRIGILSGGIVAVLVIIALVLS